MSDKKKPKAPKPDTKPPDVPSARAKASGHKKKTADKWNQ
jgi:hypothetical protein